EGEAGRSSSSGAGSSEAPRAGPTAAAAPPGPFEGGGLAQLLRLSWRVSEPMRFDPCAPDRSLTWEVVSRQSSVVGGCQLPVTSYQLPVTSYQLPVTSYRRSAVQVQTPSPELRSRSRQQVSPIATSLICHRCRGSHIGHWQLATGNRQLATGNWPLATGNWQLATSGRCRLAVVPRR